MSVAHNILDGGTQSEHNMYTVPDFKCTRERERERARACTMT